MILSDAINEVKAYGGVISRKTRSRHSIIVDPARYTTPFLWWQAYDHARSFWQRKKWVPLVEDVIADDWIVCTVYPGPVTDAPPAQTEASA